MRWRNIDRSTMGVVLWEDLVNRPGTPASLIDDFYAMELQRIELNMQISLVHSIARQALDCAGKMAHAEEIYQRRVQGRAITQEESPT